MSAFQCLSNQAHALVSRFRCKPISPPKTTTTFIASVCAAALCGSAVSSTPTQKAARFGSIGFLPNTRLVITRIHSSLIAANAGSTRGQQTFVLLTAEAHSIVVYHTSHALSIHCIQQAHRGRMAGTTDPRRFYDILGVLIRGWSVLKYNPTTLAPPRYRHPRVSHVDGSAGSLFTSTFSLSDY